MAVENELIYIVRLNAEGEQEVVRAKRVIDETGEAATKSEKKVGSLGKGMSSAGKSADNFTKKNSAASNALLDLTRIAQDAPYGIRGVANNLEQAAVSSGAAVTQFGGVTGALKGIGSALTGPMGVVAGITAFNLVLMGAESGLFSFGKETKDFAKDAEKMVERLGEINDELIKLKGLGKDELGFLSDVADTEKLEFWNLVESDVKDNIRALENYRKGIGLTKKELAAAKHSGRLNADRSGEIESVDLSEEQLEKLRRNNALLEKAQQKIKEYQSARENIQFLRDDIPEAAAKAEELRLDKLEKRMNELDKKGDEAFEKLFNEDLDIPQPIVGEEQAFPDRSDDIAAIDKRRANDLQEQAQYLAKRAKARQENERMIQQMAIQYAQNTGNRIKAIKMQEQAEIERIRNNELLDKEQKERAITAIERKYAQQRKQIAEQEARQKEELERRVMQTKMDAAAMVTNALQGFGSVIAGQSEENARQRFEANKAFNYAAAIMNTARAVTAALPNPIAASAAAASGAIQIAKIASQKFQPGVSGGDSGGSVGYRGFSFSNPASNAANTGAGTNEGGRENRDRSRESRTIRIEDGMGNLVAKGQEEIDRGGGDNYMRKT